MTEASATASIEVGVDPATAFKVFTEDIDLWWVRGPINFFDAARATAMQIEPGVGGRILEVYSPPDDVLELGRITDWEPGALFAYRSSVDDTETRIDFEAIDEGCRVTVVQSLLPGGEKAFYFWRNVIHWIPEWLERRHDVPREADRLAIALYYEDPPAAARWLHNAFGLEPWNGTDPSWIELQVGSRAIMLFKLTEKRVAQLDHAVWVYVDDLDAHFAHSQENGAKILSEIHQHGYRSYDAEDLEGHHWTFTQARPAMP